MNIFFVTPYHPSLKGGGNIAVLSNLIAISRLAKTIYFVGPLEDEVLALYSKYFSDIRIIPLKKSLLFKVLAFFLKRDPISVELFFVTGIRSIIRSCDFIFIESTRISSQIITSLAPFTPIFYSVHNCERDYITYNWSGLRKYFGLSVYARNEFETIMNPSPKISFLFLSMDDKVLFSKINPSLDIVSHHCKATLPQYISNVSSFRATNEYRLVYVGSLNLPYNYRSLLDFIKCFDFAAFGGSLLIAGRSPHHELIHLADSNSHITLVPNPVSLATIYSQSDILINPDLSGNGIKYKIAEAFSFALPVISTKNGIKGYDDIDSKCGMISDDFTDYPKLARHIITNYRKFSYNALTYYNNNLSQSCRDQFFERLFSSQVDHRL